MKKRYGLSIVCISSSLYAMEGEITPIITADRNVGASQPMTQSLANIADEEHNRKALIAFFGTEQYSQWMDTWPQFKEIISAVSGVPGFHKKLQEAMSIASTDDDDDWYSRLLAVKESPKEAMDNHIINNHKTVVVFMERMPEHACVSFYCVDSLLVNLKDRLITLLSSNGFLSDVDLTRLKQLRQLSLYNNFLTKAPIVNGLNKLEEINLESNFIQKFPTEYLDLPSLTSLNLSNNEIKILPVDAIVKSHLKYLGIIGNEDLRISRKQYETMDRALRNNAEIKGFSVCYGINGLYIDKNCILSDEDYDAYVRNQNQDGKQGKESNNNNA